MSYNYIILSQLLSFLTDIFDFTLSSRYVLWSTDDNIYIRDTSYTIFTYLGFILLFGFAFILQTIVTLYFFLTCLPQ